MNGRSWVSKYVSRRWENPICKSLADLLLGIAYFGGKPTSLSNLFSNSAEFQDTWIVMDLRLSTKELSKVSNSFHRSRFLRSFSKKATKFETISHMI